jgi:small subunit ribosomal protein S20
LPAEKTARAQDRRRKINRVVRSSTRTYVKKAELLIKQENSDETVAAVAQAVSALDRAAHKKVVHPNNVARRKSRLIRKLNTALAKE